MSNKKVQILKKEFLDNDVNIEELLTWEEFIDCLNKKGGKEFDQDIAQQLYERMEKDYDGRITLNEFIKVVLEAESILQQKIQIANEDLDEFSRQKKQALIKLEEFRRTEELNEYGVMVDSTVSVTVIEARDIKQSIQLRLSPFVRIQCGESAAQSNISSQQNPVWNENFQFNIMTGMEDIDILIMDHDENSENNFIGQISIPLNGLRDQQIHEEWFDLKDRAGINVTAQIHLKLQWIHSRVKYLNGIVSQWDEQLKNQQEDLIEYENNLQIIYEPFPKFIEFIQGGENKNQKHQIVNFNQKLEPIKPTQNLYRSGIPISNMFRIEKTWFFSSKMISTLYILFGLFVLWDRNVFLDLLIVSIFFVHLIGNKLEPKILLILCFLAFISFVFDLSWLIIFSKNWWNGSKNLLVDSKIETGLKRFVVVMSYFLFFIKIGVMISYYMLSAKLRGQSLNDSQMYNFQSTFGRLGLASPQKQN